MGSTQAAVKAALKAALVASAALSGVQILYGEADERRREAIWLGATQPESTMEPAVFRKGARDEEYVLEVHCENGTKPTPEATEARVTVLEAVIEALVIDNPTLGVSGVRWVRPDGMQLRTTESADGPVSIAVLRLKVKARLL